ncbi:MFS transporter [Bifidobacterium saguinibicoloris]|uniref:MFS transporter n=1 Tax=Bifidobacterium saguinibicoloris TaxID=2834433 RepID=UPI001C58C35F|nr:MFS transporter [Bifidobacterium saguinibicoloris]MBW3080022.1 MFS transporter [Bifidobacterium saguinibicoloris]
MVFVVALNLRAPLTSVGPLLPWIGASEHLNATMQGLLGSLPILAFAVVSPMVHRAAERLGIKRTVLAAMAFLTIGIVIRSTCGTTGLWVGTLVIGCSIAVGNVLVPAIVKRDYPGRTSLATGIYSACMTGMAAFASAATLPLSDAIGWRGTLGIWAVPAGTVTLLWLWRSRVNAPRTAVGAGTVAGLDPERRRARVATVSAAFGRSGGPEMNPLTVVASGISRGSEDSADKAYGKAYAMMRWFGVAYLAGKRWHNLSEGERTRVMISRALVSPADLLIFDEPTTGFDLDGRETVLRELSALASRRDDRTMLLVTHQVEGIPAGFDHIAMMGRMTEHECMIYLDAHPRVYATLDGNTTPGTITFTGPLDEGLTDERLESMFGVSATRRANRAAMKGLAPAAFRMSGPNECLVAGSSAPQSFRLI